MGGGEGGRGEGGRRIFNPTLKLDKRLYNCVMTLIFCKMSENKLFFALTKYFKNFVFAGPQRTEISSFCKICFYSKKFI